jgi:hypothetical protein
MPTTKKYEVVKGNTPMMTVTAAADSTTTSRRNRAANIERTDKFANIDEGVLPFRYSVGTTGREMDARDTIVLCQKAYFNIGIVRQIIDLMTEFSVGNIYFEGGNDTSRAFFEAWMSKINLPSFQDKFYREYYRSGNIFVIRYEDSLQPQDVKRIVQTFGSETQALVELDVTPLKLPARYIILNPANILYAGNISFSTGLYYQRLSDYELQRLRSPKTDEDKAVLQALPPDVQKQIRQKNTGVVNLPLNPEDVTAIFYKRQDYEPFAAPMIYPVLEDLNFKLELKKLDMAIARTQQQVILLITTGNEPDKGGINQDNILEFQKLLENQSVGRVLVADYTTKAQFVIPDIGDILTPQKYEEIDKDINIALNNVLVGGEKFANQSAKVEVFLARLNSGREDFLREFLVPEIRRISKALGFKSYPTPYYDEISLAKNDIRDRIYVQMAQFGLLTPEELNTALDTGRLPDAESSLTSQEAYKEARDKGYYLPLAPQTAGADAQGQPTGRPGGTGSPQLTKHVTPIGGSEDEQTYSVVKMTAALKAATELQKEVEKILRQKFSKKQLTQAQKDVAFEITKLVVANEDLEKWKEKAPSYCDNPVDTNPERVSEITSIAHELDTDYYGASLLYVSKNDKKA